MDRMGFSTADITYKGGRKQMLCLSLMLDAQVWPRAFKFPEWWVHEWLFCSCLIQRAQTEVHLNISSPFPPQWHGVSLSAHYGCVTSYYSFILLCSLLPPYSWCFHFHGIQKWRHQRLMYSLCTPSLWKTSHKMSLFGSVNVWEDALHFRLLERSDGVTQQGCGGCFRTHCPVLLVDCVVEGVLAFVWERRTLSKQESSMWRHNQRAVGGQGEITR